jgi:phage shock protein A
VNEREFRLRRRIDQLTDERDDARIQLEQWRKRGRKLRLRVDALTRQVETWRARAKR